MTAGKRCSKCGRTKPLGDFHLKTANRDGRAYWCKDCVSENGKRQYATHAVARLRAVVSRARQTGNKRDAWRAVGYALVAGVLVKPDRCEECERLTRGGRGGIQAHHSCYHKPLDVQWLCPTCHAAKRTLVSTSP